MKYKINRIWKSAGLAIALLPTPSFADNATDFRLVQTLPDARGYIFASDNKDDFFLARNPLGQVAQVLGVGEKDCLILFAPIWHEKELGTHLLTSGLRSPSENGGRVHFLTDKAERFYERVPRENLAEFRLGGGCTPVYHVAPH